MSGKYEPYNGLLSVHGSHGWNSVSLEKDPDFYEGEARNLKTSTYHVVIVRVKHHNILLQVLSISRVPQL